MKTEMLWNGDRARTTIPIYVPVCERLGSNGKWRYYMARKLMREYEKWRLIVKVQETKHLCIRAEAENIIIKKSELARNLSN